MTFLKSDHVVHIFHITRIFLFADTDEPPRSDAGQDVVIQLPTDWAVLDGRDSVDDHGINRYEWTLVKGDTTINMKVSGDICFVDACSKMTACC